MEKLAGMGVMLYVTELPVVTLLERLSVPEVDAILADRRDSSLFLGVRNDMICKKVAISHEKNVRNLTKKDWGSAAKRTRQKSAYQPTTKPLGDQPVPTIVNVSGGINRRLATPLRIISQVA